MRTMIYVVGVCLAIFWLFMTIHNAHARTLTHGDNQRGGKHWCNWSITSTCTRWRANGGKSYGLGCTGPNDMRSGCRYQHMK
jgi:hypothetical protein